MFKKVRFSDERTMRQNGRELAARVVNRTESGIDEDNRKFTPYSLAYAKQKHVSPDEVNLHKSGDMLAGFDVIEATDRRVVIGWKDSALEQRAGYNEDRGRRFIGIPELWVDEFIRRVRDAFSW